MIDVGTGDGRAVVAAATREPGTLVIGLDADAPSMAELSRRAARPARRGGLPNALFVVAAVEAVPVELRGLAARVTVLFPWGSLLRGCVGLDPVAAGGVASLVAAGGELVLLLAPAARDGLADVPLDPGAIATAAGRAFADHGFRLVEARPASVDEVQASGSSWARRLLGHSGARGVGAAGGPGMAAAQRQAVLIRLRRDPSPPAPEGPVEPRTSGRPADDPDGRDGE